MSTAALLTALAATVASPPISLRLDSWGHAVIAWRIAPDGRIEYAQAPSDGPPDRMVVHRARVPGARYRWVAAQLAALRGKVAGGLACTPTVTDQPYGEVSWGAGPRPARLAIRFGCKEPGTTALLERLGAVTTQLGRWAGGIKEGTRRHAPQSAQ